MTLYDFTYAHGETITRRFPMGKAPSYITCNDDSTLRCTCCEACQRECAMDV